MIAIGIDIGGTSIKAAAVDSEGKVYEKYTMPIYVDDGQDKIIDDLIALTKEYISKQNFGEEICGIGLGIPGSIDSVNGVVTYSNNLKWEELHVVDKFKKSFSCPIKITNDANAAALGESVFGAGKKYKDMVMITLGTGVGSGIIIDGKILEGKNGKGAEFGHSTLILGGVQCSCGRKGCFEAYASATALIRQTNEAMKKYKRSILWDLAKEAGQVNGKIVFDAAKAGDAAANAVVNQYVEYLSEGLLNICNIFRPDCIVLSGGIANQKEYLTDKVNEYCRKRDFGYPRSPETVITTAELGYNSGIIGAACLVLK